MTISYEDDYEYANQKLNGSYVKYGGEPVFVDSVDAYDGSVHLVSIGGGERVCQLQDLDLEPFELGYLNGNSSVGYLMRIPERNYRQGLRQSTCRFIGERLHITSLAFKKCVMNIYPTITSCYEEVVNEEVVSRAFSRNFAVVRGRATTFLYLHWKGIVVGKVFDKNGVVYTDLEEKYGYLREVLEEEL